MLHNGLVALGWCFALLAVLPPPSRAQLPEGSTFSFAQEVYSVPEGEGVEVCVTLSGPPLDIGRFTVAVVSRNGTATDPEDFVTVSDEFTFDPLIQLELGLPSQTSCTNVQTIDDQIFEGNETFTIELIEIPSIIPELYTVQPITTVTIVDNDAPTAPQIILHPENSTVIPDGGTVLLTCVATGDLPLSISWSREGNVLMNDSQRITINEREIEQGGTTVIRSILRICSTEANDAGVYSCIAENEAGSDTATFELTVSPLPIDIRCNLTVNSEQTMFSYSCGVIISEGQQDTLVCTVDGVPFVPCLLVNSLNVFDFAPGNHTAAITVNSTLGSSDSESFFFITPGFLCESEQRSIPANYVCDGISDCFDGEDELNCPNRSECSGGIRLLGGASDAEGVVQVCLDGTYALICSSGWNIADASVVCRQLGRPDDVGIPVMDPREFGFTSDTEFQANDFLVSFADCSGEEETILECVRPVEICPPPVQIEIGPETIAGAGVICRAPEDCNDGEVRLVDGRDEREGRVEICQGGIWGAVTGRLFSWSHREAAVVCLQLGYNPLGALPIFPSTFSGRSVVTLLNEPLCEGQESNLTSCEGGRGGELRRGISDGIFEDGVFPVAVRCDDYPETSDCEDGEVRLTHRQTGTIGQVQICINQTWNRIRSAIAFWNGRAAAVVCQQLGFIGEGSFPGGPVGVPGIGPEYTFTNRSCNGSESNLLLCPFMPAPGLVTIPDVSVECATLPTVALRPPSDGTYTVEVGRELEVTCGVNLNTFREELKFSIVAFRVGDPEPEPEPQEFFVPSPVLVVNFTGPPGTPANASGQYRCVVFGSTFEEVPEFFRLAERNITVSVQVPSGVGLSAALEFSVPDFRRITAQVQQENRSITREELLEAFSTEIFRMIDEDTIGLQDVSCSYLERRLIDTERSLDRVGCTITTFPAPGSAAIADPFAIAQRVVLVLEETQSVLQLFNVSALCPDPVDIDNGMVTFTGNSVGDTATYTCNLGFELIGDATTTCTQVDVNSAAFVPQPPVCRPLCPVPDDIANGMVTSSTGASVGDTATYTCNLGFELIGDATTTCTQVDVNSAAFVPQPPVCRPLCPVPDDIANGMVTFTGNSVGDTAIYTCNPDFELIGDATTTCTQVDVNSAVFSPQPPVCMPLCLFLFIINNGTITSTGNSIGDTATYTCNPGFELIGTATLTCILVDANFATFQPAAPVCRPLLCSAPSDILNGRVTFTGTSIDDTATYSCDSGFELIGDDITTCTQVDANSAEFSPDPPFCRPLCPDPVDIDNGTVISTGNSIGDTATYTCDSGFELIGDATTTCTSVDGNPPSFLPPPPSCRQIVVILLEQPQVSVSEDDGQATICMNVEGLITTEVTVSLSVNGEGGVFVTDQPPTPPTMGTDILTNPTLPTQLPTDTFGGGFSCEPITAINVCANVGYANASFPNLRGQGTQADANAELNSFLPLIETGCSNAIVHFLCAVYAPFCSPAFRNSRVMPCRDLCLYVRGTCEDELLAVGLPWPTHLNCELFPTRDDSICFGPEDPTRLQIPAIDGVSITPAPPVGDDIMIPVMVRLAPSTQRQCFNITIVDDDFREEIENISISLSASGGIAVVPPAITVTIFDNDGLCCLFNDTSFCVPEERLCDGIADCLQGEDEFRRNCPGVEPECSSGEIRLIGGASDSEGLVQLCINGTYTIICRDGWDTRDASVVCRQLGLPTAGIAVTNGEVFGIDGSPATEARLGGFQCEGSESNLLDCPNRSLRCSGRDGGVFDAGTGVICLEPANCSNGEMRLVNGADEREGRVEVCYRGIWGAVSDQEGWSYQDASVVCRNLDYQPLGALPISPSTFGGQSAAIILSDPFCEGEEENLLFCDREFAEVGAVAFVVGDSSSNSVVGVRCEDYPAQSACENGSVRLTHRDETNTAGQVQICISGVWNRVLAERDLWTDAAASVVCRQLGFTGEGSVAIPGPIVAPGIGPEYRFLFQACNGSEANLLRCPTTRLPLPPPDETAPPPISPRPPLERRNVEEPDVSVQCAAPPRIVVRPPSDGTYTVEVGRRIQVTCETDGLIVAFREGEAPIEPARPGFVRVLLSDDGILASPEGVVATSSIAGRYVCMANNRFGSTEVNINIDVQVPRGFGSSARLQFSVPELDRVEFSGLSPEDVMRLISNEVLLAIDPDIIGVQTVDCSYISEDTIDAERRLERVECGIFTYPSSEDPSQIADPEDIAQRLIPALQSSFTGFTRFATPPGSACFSDQLVCPSQNTSRCLSREALCDGTVDCGDEADERQELCGERFDVTLGFSAPSYKVEEGEEEVTVCVVTELDRPLPVGLTLPVTIRTMDGSAQRMTDYRPVIEILNFNSGNFISTVDGSARYEICVGIPIVDDDTFEENENFTVRVAAMPTDNGVIFDIPAPSTVTVLIKDNDGFPCVSENRCIPEAFLCDGISDCFGGEDELINCADVDRPECSDNDIRLVGGATDAEGVVQVCLDGTYTIACGFDGDTFNAAAVLCRLLGRQDDVGIPVSDAREFGVSTDDRNASVRLRCLEDGDFRECRPRRVRACPNSEAAGVICRAPEDCDDGEVRLVDGRDEREGRVEFCQGGIWAALVDRDNIWNREEAAVVCSELRYNPLGALPIVPSTFSGRSLTTLTAPQCGGEEVELRSCVTFASRRRRQISPFVPSPFTRNSIVAVRCDIFPNMSACEDGDVRLARRDRTNATGQVQICINETWNRLHGGVSSWNSGAAAVVCQQLGFIGEGSVALLGLDIAPETGPEYVFAGTTCNGSEPNLLLCPGGGEDEDILEDVTVECAVQPRVTVMPPSDGTYTVEVGRELEVTCAVNPGDIEPVLPDSERSQSQLSVVAFRVDAGEPELTSVPMETMVPVLNFTEAGSRGTPANATGMYRCLVFAVVENEVIRVTEESITVNVEVPIGGGSSATMEFSVPEFQRFTAQQSQQLTREERLDEITDQVFQSIDEDTVGLQEVSCTYLESEEIDTERFLERVGCNITTFPTAENIIADPVVIAQRVALLLDTTEPVFSRFTVSAPGFCDREITETSAGNYTWPMSAAGVMVSLSCVFGPADDSSTGTATRECGPTGSWMDPDLSQCRSGFDVVENITITAENYDEVINQLAIVVETADFPGEQNEENLDVITEVFLASAQLVTMDPTIVNPETVNRTLEVVDIVQNWTNTSLLGQEGPGLINSFETIVVGLVGQENFTQLVFTGESTSFVAERVSLSDLRSSGRGFSSTANLDPTTGGSENATFDEEQIASARLPAELFDQLVIDKNAEEVGVFFSIYEDAVLLPVVGVGNATVVGSPVVAATVAGIGPVRDLPDNARAVILVRLNELESGTPFNPRCVSYNFTEENWTTEGCRTIVSEDPNVIRCECNHLTNFASLVDICSRVEGCSPISPIAETVLEVLSYIGVVLSLIGVILTIVTLLVFKKLRKRDASKFHVQLCIAIFCMLLVFVAGIDRTGNMGGCVTVSALIHYFTLVAVMWMGAEALLMFQKLVIVFTQITTKYIIGVSFVCWLVPIIPVVIPLAIDRDFMVTFEDRDVNDDIRFCFIGDIRVFFGAFLAPIFAILIFNSVIFVVVIYILLKHAKKNGAKVVKKDQSDKKTTVRLLISITGVMFLFGLTWIFGALTISDASLVFQIFFVFFNAFQGFFIFLFFCVFSREARELWKETLSCGRYQSKLLHSSQARFTPSSGAAKPKSTASSNLLTLPKTVTSETTSESLQLTESRYATLNGTSDDKTAVATFGKSSPEPENEEEKTVEKEDIGTKKVEKKDQGIEDGSLKARVQRYSTKKVGKHHVESVEVDFYDSDGEYPPEDLPDDLPEVPA